jgi:2-polyprenyl-3-methyl-5-hydroxy-6-metoxy-1,4-benzoquinol methylase
VSAYDPREYWERQHARDSIAGVGQSAYDERVNLTLYRAWRQTADRFLRRQGVNLRTVLDVGAGRGDWFPVWRGRGAERIVAADLSERAVGRLSQLADEAHQLDVGEPRATARLGEFDFVAAMWVLLHITDDARFLTALANLAAAVRPGGHLLIADPILQMRIVPPRQSPHARARPLTAYAAAEMRLISIEPATIICSNPIDASGWRLRLYRRLWGITTGVTGAAELSSRIDPLLTRLIRPGPSAKLALFQRAR